MRLTVLLSIALATTALTGCIGDADDPLERQSRPDPSAVFSDTDVFPGDYDTQAYAALERGPFDVLRQETVLVPSARDGADIMIFVIRPDVPEGQRVPVIVDAGPYFPPTYDIELSDDHFVVQTFISHGFAFALVAVRGTGDSGGCMELMGPAERDDIDQAITWLGTQAWSNGRVGMFGGSYDGSTQWEAATTGNPYLKTIVPIAGIPDLFEHQVYNGTVAAWTPLQFSAVYWLLYGPALYNPATGRSAENTAAQVACPESAQATLTSLHTTATGERDPLGFWAKRDWKDEVLANYRGSIYLIQGFADTTVEPHNAYPFVTELEARGLVVKHTLGPWGHEIPWRADSFEILLHWYERWLLDDPTVDIGPKAQVQDNLGMWRSETGWPPADAARTTLHLTGDGALSPDPSSGGEVIVTPSVPVQHPGDVLTRGNGFWKLWEEPYEQVCASCPAFELGPVERDLRFAGRPLVHVTVTPTGPGGHLTALLYAIDAAGDATRVGYGQMDLRFAAGDGVSRPVVPGQQLVARLALEPTDAVVPAGGKLVLVLSQGSYGVRLPSPVSAPLLLDLSPDASTLTLDTFVRGPEAFHDAPPRVGPDAPPV